jgi:uncharacterized protein
MSLKAFEIDVVQPYSVLTYYLGEKFWWLFEDSLLKKSRLTATVRLNRAPTHIHMLFSIVGTVVLVCDRSMETFDHPVHLEKKVNFKLGKENRELATDLYMLEQKAATTNIAQHLYDFINLEVPMKRLHPRFLNDGML